MILLTVMPLYELNYDQHVSFLFTHHLWNRATAILCKLGSVAIPYNYSSELMCRRDICTQQFLFP
jgi:uncharacterized membrane protein YagU involved in acid resistance